MPAAISVFSLGSHIIKQRPENMEPEGSVMVQQGKQAAGKGCSVPSLMAAAELCATA